jgi:hypothetical protein
MHTDVIIFKLRGDNILFMKQKIEAIIKQLIASDKEISLTHMCIADQFRPDEEDSTAIPANLNAACLISLSGDSHPLHREAVDYLDNFASHPSWGKTVQFYREGLALIHSEISERCYQDEDFEKDLMGLHSWIMNPENLRNKEGALEKIRRVFFPEGADICGSREEKISALRGKRTISITALNPDPVRNPSKEVLFTSNILITIPPASKGINDLPVDSAMKQSLKQTAREEQIYWYDHPIPVGITPEHNEVLYGLEGLDKAVEFEKQAGTIDKDVKVTCILSMSATHKGLQRIAKEYLEEELKKEKNIRHLDVYVFTETDTLTLIEEILVPAAEYGRHYSFLKAVAAFWQVFIDPEIKGTFKIDLDQVFPQKELTEQSGASAFEHLKTPLWGADGTDEKGDKVELGMIAGALVNEKDIHKSLFTPDVCFPSEEIKADELIFFSTLTQALSTEAEMMTRYSDDGIDGKTKCIQRIHVTGGTNGILIDSLRKHRPFTPTFIGRAEDQAYILSVLFDGSRNRLRYVHKDGLIMRHDKEAFAAEAIKMAATGKIIGDYIRILIFSYYANALPWHLKDIKDEIDPFTGCFTSKIPLTIIYLRFTLKAASFFADNSEEKNQQGFEFIQNGVRRLQEAIHHINQEPRPLAEQYKKEKQGWNMFYDILDEAEQGINKEDQFAFELQEKARDLIKNCKINFSKQT